jgi:hypothetical protein
LIFFGIYVKKIEEVKSEKIQQKTGLKQRNHCGFETCRNAGGTGWSKHGPPLLF